MEYQVPQFIEVESKIVGPLTLRQFIYIAGTVGLCVTFFFYLPLIFALLLSAPIAALGIALAFYKVNGKPLIEMLEAGFNYYTGSKLFLWKRVDKKQVNPQSVSTGSRTPKAPVAPAQTGPRLTSGKLSELAWSLDIQKGQQGGGEQKP